MAKPNPKLFRDVMGCFATGITIVAFDDPKLGRVGITINSFPSFSLEPPLILFCLDKKAHLRPAFRRTDSFVINILSEEQQDISQHFANFHRFPAPKNMWAKQRDGLPVLRNTLGWMECRPAATCKGGDHDIVLAEVKGLTKNKVSASPLLYFQGGYRNLKR